MQGAGNMEFLNGLSDVYATVPTMRNILTQGSTTVAHTPCSSPTIGGGGGGGGGGGWSGAGVTDRKPRTLLGLPLSFDSGAGAGSGGAACCGAGSSVPGLGSPRRLISCSTQLRLRRSGGEKKWG